MYINNNQLFKNKKIVITGFNTGIGKKTCIDLLRLGADLILVGRKNTSFNR